MLVNGTKVVYLSPAITPVWSRYLAKLDEQGFRAPVPAEVAVGNQRFWVTLRTSS